RPVFDRITYGESNRWRLSCTKSRCVAEVSQLGWPTEWSRSMTERWPGGPQRGHPMLNVFALQTSSLVLASMVMLALVVGLLGPCLVEELRRGKADFGPGIPLGAADPQPGYRGNPLPGRSVPQAAPDHATLSLRSFHIVLILLSVVLASGTGMWALRQK